MLKSASKMYTSVTKNICKCMYLHIFVVNRFYIEYAIFTILNCLFDNTIFIF